MLNRKGANPIWDYCIIRIFSVPALIFFRYGYDVHLTYKCYLQCSKMELRNQFEKCYPEINKMAKELRESKIEKKPAFQVCLLIIII